MVLFALFWGEGNNALTGAQIHCFWKNLLFFSWRGETNACKGGKESSLDCKYVSCLWTGCLLAAVLVVLISKRHSHLPLCDQWEGCRTMKPGDVLFVRKKSFLMLLRPLLYFFGTSKVLCCQLPWHCVHTKTLLFTSYYLLVNAVILQNVTITSLCYLQGGFMLCLHLESALLADIYFSP